MLIILFYRPIGLGLVGYAHSIVGIMAAAEVWYLWLTFGRLPADNRSMRLTLGQFERTVQ